MEFLSRAPPFLGKSQSVFALKGPEVSTELSVLGLLQSGLDAIVLPILPHLCAAAGAPAGGAATAAALTANVEAALESVLSKHQLNEEQAGVLRAVAGWTDMSAGRQARQRSRSAWRGLVQLCPVLAAQRSSAQLSACRVLPPLPRLPCSRPSA